MQEDVGSVTTGTKLRQSDVIASESPSLLERLHRRPALLGAVLAAFTVVSLLAGLPIWLWFFGSLLLAGIIVATPDRAPSAVTLSGASSTATASRTNISWRDLIEALPDPAMVLDATGSVIHANPLVSELFQKPALGQPVTHLTRKPELIDAIENIHSGERTAVIELELRVPLQRRVLAMLSRLTTEDQSAAAPVLVVFRDMTEQDRVARMRSDFIAHASHEMRTPLAALRGFVETLQGPARDDPVARERFLSIMGAQAIRMSHLIDDLLSLSRIEMTEHLAPEGIVEIGDVIDAVADELEPLAKANDVAIKITAPPSPIEVSGERDELTQVFQNLVENAIKYGHRGGHVDVRIARDDDGRRAVVTITDNGPGIEEHHLPRLTERFYRVSATASRERGGTGLGLAIVKHIVTRHRGQLRIASTVGKGSSFAVDLPLAQE
jgi:two-component system phosphate regulon sensor histidine kinase PhoR